jgi:TPR repeat protein
MKALLAALLLAFCLLCACHRAEQDDLTKNTFQEIKAKAERGNARAQYNLGLCYKNGEGVEKDYVEAVKWFRKAAEQGHAGSQFMLGARYYYGEGVEKN